MVISSADDWPFRSSFAIPGWAYDPEDGSARFHPSNSTPPITPSSGYTNFPDLPFLREAKSDGVDTEKDFSLMDVLKENSKYEEDRSTSRSSV